MSGVCMSMSGVLVCMCMTDVCVYECVHVCVDECVHVCEHECLVCLCMSRCMSLVGVWMSVVFVCV